MIQVGIFRIDLFSFGLGFFSGAMFFFLLSQILRQFPVWIRKTRETFAALRRSMSANAEARLANEIVAYTQRQHLAASLFSLNEIAIQPTLMAPPLPADASSEYLLEEITHLVFPHMPDWPEAAAAFEAPRLTLAEALQKGASILLLGHPGSGKTFALAHFANQLLRGDIQNDFLKNKFPIMVHAADMLPKLAEKEPLIAISSAMSSAYVSPIVQSNLKNLLENFFRDGRAILLIDGLDEFDQKTQIEFRVFIGGLLQEFPALQLVVSASPDYYAGLNRLGLIPLAINAWSDRQRLAFIAQWNARWNEHIVKLLPSDGLAIDGVLLKEWVFSSDVAITPLELTLRAWGAYTGDLLAPELPRMIETHIRRLTSNAPHLRSGMEGVALMMVSSGNLLASQRDADHAAHERRKVAPQAIPLPEEEGIEGKISRSGTSLQSLLETGLIAIHPGGMVRFIHPIFLGYLAGKALAANPDKVDEIVEQSTWTGKLTTFQFMGAFSDLSPVVNQMLDEAGANPLHRELFITARWLRTSQRNQSWRSTVMRTLVNYISREFETNALSSRATVAMALSGDPGATTLFRQLLHSENSVLRKFGVIGLGLIGDPKVVAEISPLIADEDGNVGRAVCMALVRIGTKQAVDTLINILLHGSESMRIAAAGSLATHPSEGLNILSEALTMEDLLVRRAAIFGLMKINPPDLVQTLESVAVKDAQWVVRNAAAQALEMAKMSNPFIPSQLPASQDIPWLLAYAGKNGMGLANEQQAYEMALNAVERGNETEQILALQFLNLRGNQSAASHIYSTFYGSRDELRDAAYSTLWHLNAAGEELPSPVQFGMG